MDTETTPSKRRKLLKIALGVLGALVILLGIAFVLTAMKNATQVPLKIDVPIQAVIPLHVLTDEEKRLALEDFAKRTSTSTTSEVEKLRALKKFSAKAPPPILSEEQKRQVLQDFLTRSQPSQ